MIQSHSIVDRLPSRRDVKLLFLFTILPLHTWGTLVFFHQLPAYLKRMSVLNAVEIYSFTMLYVLFESSLISAVLLLVCLALSRFCQGKWVPQSAVILLALILAFLPFQFPVAILERIPLGRSSLYQIAWVAIIFFLTAGFSVLIHRSQKAASGVSAVIERLSVLSVIYLGVDILCLTIAVVSILS